MLTTEIVKLSFYAHMFPAISVPLFIANAPHNDSLLPVMIGIKFTGR
jgi:hypothetical protein